MAKLYNLAGMTTTTTGTGTITLVLAMNGHLTFAQAGVSDGDTVTYAIKDGSDSEMGRGVYTSSGTTLTRTVLKSTNSNAAISLSGTAEVYITAAAEDFSDIGANGLSGLRNKLRNANFQINQRVVSGTVTLAAGVYGHDGWKAGSGGCTYTFSTSNGVRTLTISAGTLSQVVEGGWGIEGTTTYCLSWIGTAQARINGGSYSTTGMTSSLTGGSNATVEFGTGTLSLPQLERGSTPSLWESRGQIELILCQRYFSKSMRQEIAPADGANYSRDTSYGVGGHITSGQMYAAFVYYPVTMRSVPTLSFYRSDLGTINGRWQFLKPTTGWVDSGPVGASAISETGFSAFFTVSGLATQGAYAVQGAWTASAEL